MLETPLWQRICAWTATSTEVILWYLLLKKSALSLTLYVYLWSLRLLIKIIQLLRNSSPSLCSKLLFFLFFHTKLNRKVSRNEIFDLFSESLLWNFVTPISTTTQTILKLRETMTMKTTTNYCIEESWQNTKICKRRRRRARKRRNSKIRKTSIQRKVY